MNYTFTDKTREQFVFWLITLAMGISVALYSGKTVYALLILEVIGYCLLLLTLWQRGKIRLGQLTSIVLTFIVLSPLIYLIPIPQSIWEMLPGRSAYTEPLNWLIEHNQTPWLSLSIVPLKTLHAFIALIPLVAIFLATASLSSKKQLQLAYVFLAIASVQAIIGLIQYSNPTATWLFFEFTNQGNAQGTYLNRDHFSALMHISLPMAIGLVACNIGRKEKVARDVNTLSLLLNKVLIFSVVVMLILLGGIFARSRAGVFLIILAIILSLTLFAKHIGGKRSAGLAATIGTLGLGSAISIGLVPVLNRFIVTNPMEDLRWKFFADAISGIKTFFPFGSGPSTFQDVYRTLQPIERLRFVNHVHNDYLELVFEMGVIGILILALLLILYVWGWVNMKNYSWGNYRFIKVAAGIGLFLILLHSLVDFNMHTPANAIFVAFLAGLFLNKQEI